MSDTNLTSPRGEIGVDPDAVILDPRISQRRYCTTMGVEREIWRPGDGDGDQFSDTFMRADPPKTIEGRWRFYQLSLLPIKYNHNEPPKFVILDDRAAFEVIMSDIPRATIGKNWPHDFGESGKIRHRRPHRGRGSVGDANARGDDKYNFSDIGVKNSKYYFTGGKNYTAIVYRSTQMQAELTERLRKKPKAWTTKAAEKSPAAVGAGHNQYTPKEQLVKHSAQTQSGKKRPRAKPVPEWLVDKAKLPGMTATRAEISSFDPANTDEHLYSQQDRRAMQHQDMAEPDEPFTKRRKIDAATTRYQDDSPQDQMFPFHHNQLEDFESQAPDEADGNVTLSYRQAVRTGAEYTSRLEQDLTMAHELIDEQKERIEYLESMSVDQQGLVEQLRHDLEDLRSRVAR